MNLTTACGTTLVVSDQTKQHLVAHPEAADLLEEAVGKVTLPKGNFLKIALDMGRTVGKNPCLRASRTDVLHFSVRTGRDVPTRVLPDQEPEDTSMFVLIAGKKDDTPWALWTGYVGSLAPREPHDPYFTTRRDSAEFAESVEFWTTHGLCVGEGWGPVTESTWEEVLREVDAQRAAT